MSFSEAVRTIKQLDITGNPIPFDIDFVTADKRRKIAGEIKSLTNCIKESAQRISRGTKHKEKLQSLVNQTKDPNHRMNGTTNIVHQDSKKKIKIHWRLIIKLNGQRVIY